MTETTLKNVALPKSLMSRKNQKQIIMKKMRLLLVIFFALFINLKNANANGFIVTNKPTAETVFTFAENMNSFDESALKNEIIKLSIRERVKLVKMAIKDAREAQMTGAEKPGAGMYILAIVLPPVAVGIHTSWGEPTLYNVLWCCLGYAPGIIHAFIVLGR